MFLPTDDTNASTAFYATYTITLKSGHTVMPSLVLGFDEMDYYICTQAQGWTDLHVGAVNSSLTQFNLYQSLSNQTNLVRTSVNYLVIHNELLITKRILTFNYQRVPSLSAINNNSLTVTYPLSVSIPHLNYRILISATRFKFYRNNDLARSLVFSLTRISFNLTTIDLLMSCSYMYMDIWSVYLVFIDRYYDNTPMEILELNRFSDSSITTTVARFNFSHIIANKVKPNTFFIGLSYFKTLGSHFQYKTSHNSMTDSLDALISIVGTDLFYAGLSFYGYKCNPPFYLSAII